MSQLNPETRSFIAQFTAEPPEEVVQRLDQRLKSPLMRHILAGKFDEQRLANLSWNRPSIYSTEIEITSILVFGENWQRVDMPKPPELSEKDLEILAKFRNTVEPLFEGNFEEAETKLREVPLVKGSECDKGIFDGYNQEVLIATSLSTIHMLEFIKRAKSAQQGNLAGARKNVAIEALYLHNGFTGHNRTAITEAFINLQNATLPPRESISLRKKLSGIFNR